jgi:hypothetical protein
MSDDQIQDRFKTALTAEDINLYAAPDQRRALLDDDGRLRKVPRQTKIDLMSAVLARMPCQARVEKLLRPEEVSEDVLTGTAIRKINEHLQTTAARPNVGNCPIHNCLYNIDDLLAEGEELGSNLLHVDQRTPANSGGRGFWQSTGQGALGRRPPAEGPTQSVLGKASGRNAGQTAPAGDTVWPVEQLGTLRWTVPVQTVNSLH